MNESWVCDFKDTPIEVGNNLAVANRRGSSIWLNLKRVTRIDYDSKKIYLQDTNGKSELYGHVREFRGSNSAIMVVP